MGAKFAGDDCQLSFKDESTASDTSYLLGGICKIIRMDRGEDMRKTLVNIPDTSQGFEG